MRAKKAILGLSALALAYLPAAGQTPGVLFRDGDPIIGVGGIDRISYIRVADSGTWLSLVEADITDNNLDFCLMRNGYLTLREGMNLPQPPGASLDEFGSMHMNSRGELGLNLRIRVGSTTSGSLYWNLVLVAQKGTILNIPPFSPDTTLEDVIVVRIAEDRQILAQVKVRNPLVDTRRNVDALMRFRIDAQGNLLEMVVLGTKGMFNDVLGAPIDTLGTTQPEHSLALNQLGDFVIPVSGIGSRGIMKNLDTMVARELDPAPVPGRTWNANAFSLSKLDINDRGDIVYTGTMTPFNNDPGEPTNFLIVKNDEKFAQSGDVIPALSPATLGKGTAEIAITNRGDVIWRAQPTSTTSGGAAFMKNLAPVIQESITIVEGNLVNSIAGGDDCFAVSPEGRFLLARAVLQSVGDVVLYVDFGLVTELPGCSGNPGRLVHLSGDARIGQQIRIGMDDGPFPGALPILFFSRNSLMSPAGCGVPTTAGELLLGAPFSNLFLLPAWDGVNPSVFTVNVPPSMALVNANFFVQGLFGNPNQARSFKLTNGLKYEIGPP